MPRENAFVELQQVTLVYGRGRSMVPALGETSLQIAKGDFVALVGPSGCGKSTILKLVSGLIPASSGCVFVAGHLRELIVADQLHESERP